MTKLKPFNLERALAGDPVVSRVGRKVVEIHCFNSDIECPLCSLIEGEDRLIASRKDGKFSSCFESAEDLFMAPKTKTYWMNVHRLGERSIATSKAFDSKELAEAEAIFCGSKLLKTISFEVEC